MNDVSFALLLNKELLSVYSTLSTGLRAGKAAVNKTSHVPASQSLKWDIYISKKGTIMLGKE